MPAPAGVNNVVAVCGAQLFATYSIWSNSLKGTTTRVGEVGNLGGAAPPYNRDTNQGWLFGICWKSGFKLPLAG